MKQKEWEKRLDQQDFLTLAKVLKGKSLEKLNNKLKAFIKQEIKRVIGEDEELNGAVYSGSNESEKHEEVSKQIRNQLKAEQRRKAEIKWTVTRVISKRSLNDFLFGGSYIIILQD